MPQYLNLNTEIDIAHFLVHFLVFLIEFRQLCQSVLTGCSFELVHSLQKGLIVFLQLQQAARGQLVHLLAKGLLRN